MIGPDICGNDRQTSYGSAIRLPDQAAVANLLTMLVLGALGAAVSLALSGYQFGIINNVFHLPIVGALYNEPQFSNDAFIQSLRYFSSGVWMLLEGSARYISPYWLFLGLDYLSRLLSFVALLCCGTLLGVQTTRERFIFVVILCFSSLLHGYSYPGNGGLFVNYFTHSEIANGTILLAIYFAVRRRFAAALALIGVTFFVNAFMAVWVIPPLGLIAALALWRREITIRSFVLHAVTGLMLAAIVASPVLINILGNPGLGASAGVDHRTYLLRYYPDHILFAVASARHMLSLALVTVDGFACFFMLGRRAGGLQAALVGALLLYIFGIVAPCFTGLPAILDLHLIRSSAVIHLLAALAAASLATRWLCDKDRNRSKFFGPLLVLADCTSRSVLPLGLATIAAAEVIRRSGYRPSLFRLDYAVGALLVFVLWPRAALQNIATNSDSSERTRSWEDVGAWARRATPPDALFLAPVERLPGETSQPPPVDAGFDPTQNSEIFEFASHRRIWVDFRRGAAVLWAPSYYAPWWSRVTEVMALHSLADKLTYARAHHIDYVIDACRNAGGGKDEVAFRTAGLCVYAGTVSTGAHAKP